MRMNTTQHAGRLSVIVVGLAVTLALFGLMPLGAQTLVEESHTSIAPLSIPLDADGNAPEKVGMTRLEMRRSPPTSIDGSVGTLTVELTGDIAPTDVERIYVFYEPQSAAGANNGVYDRGTVGANPSSQIADVAAAFDGARRQAISGLEGSNVITDHRVYGNAFLYIAFDFATGVDASKSVGCRIFQLEYGAVGVGTGTTISPAAHGQVVQIDDYATQLAATSAGVVPVSGAAGSYVTALRLDFLLGDDSLYDSATGGHVTLDRLRFRIVGTAEASDLSSVVVFQDTGGAIAGQYEPEDRLLGTGSISGSGAGNLSATVTLSSVLQVDSDNDTYYAAVLVGSGAVPGNTVGLQVEDPSSSTNARFIDGINDQGTGTVNFEYPQTGYITSTTATPGSPDTFVIIPPDDGKAPSVDFSIPTNQATNVDPDQVLTFLLSEPIDEATLDLDPAGGYDDFVLTDFDSNVYPGTLAYNPATRRLTFTPDGPLPWATTLRAIVGPEIYDFASPPNPMDEPYVLTFTTRPEFPVVTEPTAINNRIVSGGNSRVVMLIPEPPGGAAARMSVQVFTTTGKLVRTFYRDTAYATIEGDLPIRWDGTNEQGRALGPGMYFVQIRSGSYKRVLRVLIVR